MVFHRSLEVTPPPSPKSMSDLGLTEVFLSDLAIKTLVRQSIETTGRLAQALCVSVPICSEIVNLLRKYRFVETAGEICTENGTEIKLEVTTRGRSQADKALSSSGYFGAVPVPIKQFEDQIKKQMIDGISISPQALDAAFSDLVVPDNLKTQLGPAVNSGSSMMVYGSVGNGKSSMIHAIATAIDTTIFVPQAVEIAGQIVIFYDYGVHGAPLIADGDMNSLRVSSHLQDRRYHACRRPYILTGGELRLRQLELEFNPVTKVYTAPLQFKAMNGVFALDDLGRQVEKPQDIINRWIVPLGTKQDMLTLVTGEKVTVPFDTLMIFSSNFHPKEILDPAALRRIQYKIKVDDPSREQFLEVLYRTAKSRGISLPDEFVVDLFSRKYPTIDNVYANFHAVFIINHIQNVQKYNSTAKIDGKMLDAAWENIFVNKTI